MIKDNRFETFNQAIGFEKDEYSGLWLPTGTVIERDCQQFAFTNFHGTSAPKRLPPQPPITIKSIEDAISTIDPERRGLYYNPQRTPETDIGDEVEAWLEAMQEEG